MEAFREALRDANLYDLGFRGSRYTWVRDRSPTYRICERFDRAVASPEWRSLFPTTIVRHLSSSWSDHAPICISIKYTVSAFNNKRRRRETRKFEQLWLGDEECERKLVENWHGMGAGDPVASLVSCAE